MTAKPRWLSIVGIGEDGLLGLGQNARDAVLSADVIVGGERHLAMLDPSPADRIRWPSPFDALANYIRGRAPSNVCVLATGDPFCFGVGTVLTRDFSPDEMMVYPAPSGFSLACARLGWSLPDIATVSLHGRPLNTLQRVVRPGARILALAHDGNTPRRVAEWLAERGYEESSLWVMERLGGADERVEQTLVVACLNHKTEFHPFHVLALECRGTPKAMDWSTKGVLPDAAFSHDGQLTKQIVRAATMASLAPTEGQCLWDIGAGCGSIGIEWLRAAPSSRAVAVEQNSDRVKLINTNANSLGVPHLEVVNEAVPAALSGLPSPHAIFVGGAVSQPDLLRHCYERLSIGGRLVANSVTLAGERALIDFQENVGGELHRISVATTDSLGQYRAFRPALAVVQLCLGKPPL